MPGSSKAFRKHGTFFYRVPATIERYGTVALVVEAMKEAQMTHAWVRIHGQASYPAKDKKVIGDFVGSLRQAGIAVAGWGWCQGTNPEADARLALRELSSFDLADYVADIEHGVHNANWTVSEMKEFCESVRTGCAGGFGITTFPLIDWHEPELMKAALPFVDMFNPQIYWHNLPDRKMLKQFKRSDGSSYTLGSAADYVELCLDRWDRLMGDKPRDIVITGQAYWGEGKVPFTQGAAEENLDEFLDGWGNYNRAIGLNWWHFGDEKSMSHRMQVSIRKAKLGSKPYRK